MACGLALRLMDSSLPSFAGWSGYPSIAALLINPGIDVMGQKRPHSITSTSKQHQPARRRVPGILALLMVNHRLEVGRLHGVQCLARKSANIKTRVECFTQSLDKNSKTAAVNAAG